MQSPKICEETEGAPELGTRINSPDDVTTSPVKSPTRSEKTPSPRPAKNPSQQHVEQNGGYRACGLV